jgi:hypothetical protein
VLVAVVTYLLATNGFLAIALVLVLVQAALFTWMWWRVRRQSRGVYASSESTDPHPGSSRGNGPACMAEAADGHAQRPMSRPERLATLLLYFGILLAVVAVVVLILVALRVVTVETSAAHE